MLNVIEGDVVDLAYRGRFDVMFHGAHCHNFMGHGVAARVAEVFPAAFQADQATSKGDRTKMGTYSYAVCESAAQTPVVIVNGYTQFYYGVKHYRDPQGFDYKSFTRFCDRLAYRFSGRGLRFGFPLIGGDRGNADPYRLLEQLVASLPNEKLTLVVFSESDRRKQYSADELRRFAAKMQ